MFRRNAVRWVFRYLLPVKNYVTQEYSENSEKAADGNGQEYQAGLFQGKPIYTTECVGHCGEEAEQSAESTGDV